MDKILRAIVIDQGTADAGFAIVDNDPKFPVSFGAYGRLYQHGAISAPQSMPLVDRLLVIESDIETLIAKYAPDEMVLEETMNYRQKSGRTANAMPAIYMTCHKLARKHGMAFYTQYPQTIKLYVAGYGKADKDAVKEAVMQKWGLMPHHIKSEDHADALAGAYTWLMRGWEVRLEAAAKKKGKK